MVGERWTCPARASPCQQRGREIQSVDAKPGLGEQMTVPALPARHVEHPRVGGQSEQFEQARDLLPVALEREQWLVLAQIVLVEVPRPPLAFPSAQKKTGSRYAPKTLSSAARISYSVQ